MTVWTSRYGKLGLKMIGSHDPAGTNCPRALIAKPTGVCIQLFAAMIQVAEMSVPSATMQVAKKCSRLPTLEMRSEEHTSELQSLMRISYAVFCLKKKNEQNIHNQRTSTKQKYK